MGAAAMTKQPQTTQQAIEIDHDKVAELALRVDQAVRNVLEKEDQSVGFYALVTAATTLVSYETMQRFLDEVAVSSDARERITSEVKQ